MPSGGDTLWLHSRQQKTLEAALRVRHYAEPLCTSVERHAVGRFGHAAKGLFAAPMLILRRVDPGGGDGPTGNEPDATESLGCPTWVVPRADFRTLRRQCVHTSIPPTERPTHYALFAS